MKKRLLVYLSVIIGCLFIGLTTYYLVKSYEVVSATGSEAYYLNISETDKIDIVHTYPAEDTKLEYSTSQEGIISFDPKTGIITALSGGETDLTITTTNEKYGPFTFKIFVGDGKDETTPFYIKTADDLAAIGKERIYSEEASHSWTLDACYQLISDIDLKGIEWESIGFYTDADNIEDDNIDDNIDNQPFIGQFFGDGYTIKNLTIKGTAESAGLFTYLAHGALIENIKFDNASIDGAFDIVGIVAGVSEGSIINLIEVVNSSIFVSPRVVEDDALAMAGGIVGFADASYWEEEGSLTGYAYERTNVNMCSFTGRIGISDSFIDIVNSNEVFISLGGIVGFSTGAVIFNNKADVSFDVNENLPALLIDSESELLIGGIIGLIDMMDIKDHLEIDESIFITPWVKNNLAIITVDFQADEINGVIGKVTDEVQNIEEDGQCVWGNYFYSPNGKTTLGGSTWEDAAKEIPNEQALKNKSTYKTNSMENWSIGELVSVWALESNDTSPRINFENGMPQEMNYLEGPYSISTNVEFKFYYDKMTAPATTFGEKLSRRFWLSQSYILENDINLADVEITKFIPIGDDYPFVGVLDGNGKKLYFKSGDDDKLHFTNNKLADAYEYTSMGLFSYLKGTLKNLTLENPTINFGEFAGVFAGVNDGQIIDCVALSPQILDGVYYGLMVGFNKGFIINTNESGEEISYSINLLSAEKTLGIMDTKNSIYIGGAVGFNFGNISNIKISGELPIIADTSTNNSLRIIGGFVAYNSGIIENSSLEKAYISDNSKSLLYIGGFCGINDGAINRSYTGEASDYPTTIVTDISQGRQMVGGFAARIGYEGSVHQSFANVSLKGYYVAGFSPTLLGKVSECYVKGSLEGEFSGGFASTLSSSENPDKGGSVVNCYTILTITGLSDSSVSAGIALLIKSPGKVEKSFFSNTFVGKGKKYLEAYTDTRSKIFQLLVSKFAPTDTHGTVNNVIIDTEAAGNNKKEVIESGKFFKDKSQKVYYITSSIALNAAEVLTKAKFNVGATGIWTLEVGKYPILTNLDLDGISQLSTQDDFFED